MAFIVRNTAVQHLLEQGLVLAQTDEPLLLFGEPGTGKEHFARHLHAESHRRKGPFIRLDCSAVPDTLWEAELFGRERAAPVRGKLELAHTGTLFLAEAAAMPTQVQARLQLFLETGSFYPGGATERRSASVRLIASVTAAPEGRLFHRFTTLTLPPLRERKEDIELLARMTLTRFSISHEERPSLTAEAIATLLLYDWPGNVQELETVLRRAVLLASPGPIAHNHLPPELTVNLQPAPPRQLFKRYMRSAERLFIGWALTACNGDRTKTARFLGLSRAALYKKLKLYPGFRAEA